MGRPRGQGQGFKNFGVNLDGPTADALQDYADTHFNGKPSVALREIVEQHFKQGRDSHSAARDRGYNDGLRQGKHEALEAMQQALEPLWR